MDDLNAFERRVAAEVIHGMGPSEPVDDLEVFDAVVAANRQQRWGFTVFTVLRFVVATVIVVLFGGFVLAGIVPTQQADEMAPAAATESLAPMTSDELLSGMVAEEVEPRVLRVVNDGVRDISIEDLGYPSASVDVAPDGRLWLSAPGQLLSLGDEAAFPAPDHWPPYPAVGPDGLVWVLGQPDYIQSFDGTAWARRAGSNDADLHLRSLAVGPDGTVWVVASDQHKLCAEVRADCIGTVLLRLESDGTMTTIGDWADVYDGEVADDELAVSPDGDVWLIGMRHRGGLEAVALLRFDGDAWELVPGPDGFVNHPLGNSVAFGPDGMLWVHIERPEVGSPGGDDRRTGGVARFDGSGWTIFSGAEGVEAWGGTGFIATDLLAVAPDGSLWMNGTSDLGSCTGVDHYDGSTWAAFLPGSCIHDLAVGADGSVWVRANRYGGMNPVEDIHTYVITPEPLESME